MSVRRHAALYWMLVAPILMTLPLWIDDSATRTITWPLAAAFVILIGTLVQAHDTDAGLPLDEAGAWAVLTTALYTILPLSIAMGLHGEFTPLNDARLFQIQPAPSVLAHVGWLLVLYLASLAVAYLVMRPRRQRAPDAPRATVKGRTLAAVVLLFGLGTAVALVLTPDTTAGTGYAGTYLAVQSLPLGVRQLLRLVVGVRQLLGLGLLLWAFGNWRRRRRWVVLAALVLGAATILHAGERTTFGMLLVSCLALYHRNVRPVGPWAFAALLLTGMLGFTALGVYRELRGAETPGTFSMSATAGEFDVVFANAVDLLNRREQGGFVPAPASVLLADLTAPIPSQLLPFPKQDPADWYLTTYYPALKDAGGGLAFGVVAGAILGFGAPELVLLGLLMGTLFALIDRWAARRRDRLWPTIVQLWTLIFAYQTVRATSLAPFSALVQQIPVAILLVWLTRQLVRVPATIPHATHLPQRGELAQTP